MLQPRGVLQYLLMLNLLLTLSPAPELVFRMVTTSFIVIAVALAVGRFGPLIGGAIAGLPIVLGPGFYFLIARAPTNFVSEAAAYSVLSLCATQVFTFAYIATAANRSPLLAIAIATCSWFISVSVLRLLPPDPWLAIALFILFTAIARKGAAHFRRDAIKIKRSENLSLLLLRGGLAGILVAVVTASANHLGTDWSGLLLAYPVGYTVIAVTIHRQFGSNILIATLTSTLLGTGSLAAFCASLSLALRVLPPYTAFISALAISFAVTTGLVVFNRLKQARSASLS